LSTTSLALPPPAIEPEPAPGPCRQRKAVLAPRIVRDDAPRTSVPTWRVARWARAIPSASLRTRRARARGGAGAHTRRRRAYAAGAAVSGTMALRWVIAASTSPTSLGTAHVRATAGAECRKRIP